MVAARTQSHGVGISGISRRQFVRVCRSTEQCYVPDLEFSGLQKKQGMWHCLIPSGQITGKQLSVPTSYTLAQIKKWVSEKFDGGHAFESLRELHHHIIFCWAMQGVKLASLECSIIQGAHMAMQYGLVSAPQKSQKVSLKWKPLQQCSDAEKPGQNSTGHEVLDGYDSFVLW